MTTQKNKKTPKNKTRKIQKGGKKYENMDDYMFDEDNSFYNDIFDNTKTKMEQFREMWESFFSIEDTTKNKKEQYQKCETTLRILNSIDYKFDKYYNEYIDLLNFAKRIKDNFFEEVIRNGGIERFKEKNAFEKQPIELLTSGRLPSFNTYTNVQQQDKNDYVYSIILPCLTLNRDVTDMKEEVSELRFELSTFYDVFGFNKKGFNPEKLCKNNIPVIVYIYKFLIFDLSPAMYEIFCGELINDAEIDKDVKKNVKYLIEYCIKINSPKKLIQFMESYSTKRYENYIGSMYCYFSSKGGIEKYREINYSPIIVNVDNFISKKTKYTKDSEWDLEFELEYDKELLKNDIKLYKNSESESEEDVLKDPNFYKRSDLIVKHNSYQRMSVRIKEYKSNSIVRKNRVLIIDNNLIIYDTMDVYIECDKMVEQCTGSTKIVLLSYIDYFINLNIKSDGTFLDNTVNDLLSNLRREIQDAPSDTPLDETYVENEIIKAFNLDGDLELNDSVLHILQKFYLLELALVAKTYLFICLSSKFGQFYGCLYPLLLLASENNAEIFRVLNRNTSYFFDDYNYIVIKEFIEKTLSSYDVTAEDINLYIDIVTPIKESKYICSNYMLNRTKDVVVTIQFLDIMFGITFTELQDILLGTFVNVSISKNINDLDNVEHLSKCLIAWNPLLETEKERIQNSLEINEVLSRTFVGEFPDSTKFFYDCIFKTTQESFTSDSLKQSEAIKRDNAEFIYDPINSEKIAKQDKDYLLKLDALKSV